jgi:hypothetical protein
LNKLVSPIAEKARSLVSRGSRLLATLEQCGWPDDRPEREDTRIEDREADLAHILGDYGQVEIPATARIPDELRVQYDKWYSACLGLVSANMLPRSAELMAANQEANGILTSDYMNFDGQLRLARCIRRVNAIVNSVPEYVDARLHDLQMAVAEAYIGDELNEALALLEAGYTRCAGAIAGVLLERHLKLVCERQRPPIKYAKRDGIAKLNAKLKDALVYDLAQWRKVEWMGDIRNACDHTGTSEPRKEDVGDMIAGVRKFVSLV